MDPSALIFVALAVAWAAYLIPKALEHHEESARSRSIDKFSDRMRILARREPLGRRRSALVTVADAPDPADPQPAPEEPSYVAVAPSEALVRARRRAAVLASRRRRRVLDLLGVAGVAVAAVVILGLVDWRWLGAPAGLVVVWLLVCRVRTVRERRALTAPVLRRVDVVLAPQPDPVTASSDVHLEADLDVDALLDERPPLRPEDDEVSRPDAWEMLPFVVPTYVGKEKARRTVRTIDLDSTGVWSSGRNDADSALVRRSADAGGSAAAAPAPVEQDEERRATGS